MKGAAVVKAGRRSVWSRADKASSPLSICSGVRVWPAEEGVMGERSGDPLARGLCGQCACRYTHGTGL